MQILLANAKIMNSMSAIMPLTTPLFQSESNIIAEEMARMDVNELSRLFSCSKKIAHENWERYRQFPNALKMPAIMAYNGQAYKHLKADTLSEKALKFSQEHLWITCFLYGLLRPMDAVAPYRMEHFVRLEATGDKPLDQFWKDKLTDILINSVKADDGILIHLSTEEYEHLFDWKRVLKEVNVIQPQFYVLGENGKPKIQAVWAKTCRGAMVRYILENQLTSTDALKSFCYEGFEYTPKNDTDSDPSIFIRNNLVL